MVFLALCLLSFLSIFSYNPDDIGILHDPPLRPTHNLSGPVGAWFGFITFVLFGLSGYLVPPFFLFTGLMGLLKSEQKIWPRLAWFAATLVSLSALFGIQGDSFELLQSKLNLGSPGGVIGYFLAQRTLGAWFGKIGMGILATTLLLISLSFITENYPGTFLRRLVKKLKGAFSKFSEHNSEQKQKRAKERKKKRSPKKAARPHATLEKKPAAEKLFGDAPVQEKKTTKTQPEGSTRPITSTTDDGYQLPGLELLDKNKVSSKGNAGVDLEQASTVLQETLSDFGIDATVTDAEVGPVVTSYEILPNAGVRVEKIANLSNNIALAMKARSVRVEAPIPGKGVVGVEIPNPDSQNVYLRQLVSGKKFRSGKLALPLALGKDVGGNKLLCDLTQMPHILIAGATGSGKTVCMNSLLTGLLMANTPQEMRLMLVDPKIVEFQAYKKLPHLVVPVITDPKKVALGLRWAIDEMEKRYNLFAQVGVRDIKGFNSRPTNKQQENFLESNKKDPVPQTLPYIVIIVDELADLMAVAQADIESGITRLAQLSRAVGIHMIIATQRPSVNVITGTIKANFPARIAFQVAQKVDSRTILDAAGADKLLGRGDMLFAPPGSNKLIRAQGTLTSDEEICRVTDFIRQQRSPEYVAKVKEKIESKKAVLPDVVDEDDEMLEKAIEVLRQTKRASTSSLQRRLRIGYNRAARLMDALEAKGIVGPPEDTGPRDILIDFDGEIPSNQRDDGEGGS